MSDECAVAGALLSQHERVAKHPGQLAPSNHGRDQLRLRLFEMQKGQCHWCYDGTCKMPGVPLSLERTTVHPTRGVVFNRAFASFEHLTPWSKGGRNTKDNLAVAHAYCNNVRQSQEGKVESNQANASGEAATG